LTFFSQFQNTGDFIFPNFRQDLEYLLDQGVRVNLFYGDADYICSSPLVPTSIDPFSNKFTGNWFGGQAISLQVNYTHAEQFAAAGYEPFVVDGTEYGEVRQYGNCKLPNTANLSVPIENKNSQTLTVSFLRIYEAGHEVPFYQPKASLAMFQRVLEHLDIGTGLEKVTAEYETEGGANATHTEPYVALPSSTAMPASTGGAVHGLGFRA
jgi:carboxypeptidase C (cathepsin A)